MGMKRKTLSFLFFKLMLQIAVVGVIIAIIYINITILGLKNGFLVPANEPIQRSDEVSALVEKSKTINSKQIPKKLDYAIYNRKTGKLVESNLNKTLLSRANNEITREANSNSFLKYESKEEILLIYFNLKVHFADINLRKIIYNPGIWMTILMLLIYIFFIIFNIRRFNKAIVKENQKLIEVANQIKSKDLNLITPSVDFLEYAVVMEAMESLASALNQSIKNEIESSQSKEEQISYLVHDIKIPLTVIKGNIELMQLEKTTIELECFQDVMTAIKQIEYYISEVININLNKKEMILTKEPLTIQDFLIKLNENVIKSTNTKQVIINNNINKKDIIVIDMRLIIRALTNILLNGLERTPSGGQVIIQLNQVKANYEFIITDQGNGFNEDSLKNGFKLFFTENHSRSSGYKTHYGLGLTFAEKVIRLHNGEINLYNTEAHHGKVVIKIPK